MLRSCSEDTGSSARRPRPALLGRVLRRRRNARRDRGEASLRRTAQRVALRAFNKRWTVWWFLRSRLRSALGGWGWREAAPRPGESAPAFDLRACNPIHWPRAARARVAALGPLERLPPGVRADRAVRAWNPLRLRRYHHVEDAPAFHAGPAARAGALARLAAAGVVVHAADADPRLEALLGAELHRLITAGVDGLDAGARELRSIGLRRAALRNHSTWARGAAHLPYVSVLLATRRPALVPQALAAVAAQTYPRLELVLALHGNEAAFAGVERRAAELALPCRIVRVAGGAPLGAVLNAAVAAAGGELLTKMDDDDRYGADHVWDLVLAREYSRAQLVGKAAEFIYLAASDRMVHRFAGEGEAYRYFLIGGTLLIARSDLEQVGGWRNVPAREDLGLVEDVLRAGGAVYRTHGAGFVLVRHGAGHAWAAGDDYFLSLAGHVSRGWNPALAGLPDRSPRPPAPAPGGAGPPPAGSAEEEAPPASLLWRAANKRRTVWWVLRSRLGAAERPPARGAAPARSASAAEQAPAFDLRRYNPIHWPRAAGAAVAALGPLDRLPPGVTADCAVRRRDPLRLRRYHHVEDAPAFHAGAVTRAGALVRLAAAGVVVHAADAGPRLRALLGGELHRLLTAGAGALDAGARELRSIGLRRAALREHSSWARAAALLPSVSVLLATRRPALVPQALAAVAAQTYPRLELVLALHGNEAAFAGVERRAAELALPCRIVRVAGGAPLGAVLNAAVAAAGGELLTKMDDDDRYGADHVWDLVLAREYSRAQLVGKAIEFIYLARSDRTLYRAAGRPEAFGMNGMAGGALLISRRDLEWVGGWRNARRGVDQALIGDVLRAGGGVYRTHSTGFALVRHGDRHTWELDDGHFLARADRIIPGWAAAAADVAEHDA